MSQFSQTCLYLQKYLTLYVIGVLSLSVIRANFESVIFKKCFCLLFNFFYTYCRQRYQNEPIMAQVLNQIKFNFEIFDAQQCKISN